jgi:hypothetical protein
MMNIRRGRRLIKVMDDEGDKVVEKAEMEEKELTC